MLTLDGKLQLQQKLINIDLAGKNCQIESIEDIEIEGRTGKKVTFVWYGDDDTVKHDFISVMDGIDGEDGESPIITVVEDTDTSYILHIKTASGEFDTPNLKGSGSGGTNDYNDLINKPTIGGKEIEGDMDLDDIGDVPISDEDIIDAVSRAFGN